MLSQKKINKILWLITLILIVFVWIYFSYKQVEIYFAEKQVESINEILKVEFKTWSFFEIEKDFKSSINIDFSLDFYKNKWKTGSDEFIKNKTKAKEKLISLLDISPHVKLLPEDIILYKKRAILNLNLKPKTEYKFILKSFNNKIWSEIKNKGFIFNTPKNKFFGFRINNKVSLFMDTKSPNFTFYKYNSPKKEAKIKICRIDNEAYSKIEVYDNFPDKDFRKNFFKSGIDKIKTLDCKYKTISLENTNSWTWKISKTSDLIKREFNFEKEIWNPARSGLYYITFADEIDREYNKIVQAPIFFWIINSHITMKISANKQWFFFVNNFAWEPLVNQEIIVYLNNFKSKKAKYNYKDKKDESIYYSPFETSVLSKGIYLWKTNKNGILNVDLKWKIDDAYYRTFNSYNYSWDWNLNSLFVTSSSNTNLSYVSSKHNWWITPWNFGYSLNTWWYKSSSKNQDEITLQKRGKQQEIYSHIFADRKLYLPNEEVHIKSILRNSSDLSIPRNKEIDFIVTDSKWKKLIEKKVKVNNFGSISESFSKIASSLISVAFSAIAVDAISISKSFFFIAFLLMPVFFLYKTFKSAKSSISRKSKGIISKYFRMYAIFWRISSCCSSSSLCFSP